MAKYTVKQGDDLGSIAAKFGMPSWKYLYELNKDAIGENPDLLPEGTELKIPQWDATGGDEKIEDKGATPMQYTGGLQYAYPWVPFSVSLVDENDGSLLPELNEPCPYVIRDGKSKKVVHEGSYQQAHELSALIPASGNVNVGIKGFPMLINNTLHIHPDDEIS